MAAIIVHGGAWDIPAGEHEAHQNGCRRAALTGHKILTAGGTALDAIEAAITILEDNPAFDAGTGSHLNRAGGIQLDAGVMDGATLNVGAVAAIERVKNPIQAACRLLTSPHNMFAGPGATAWAEEAGIDLVDPAEMVVLREQQRYEQGLQGKLTTDTEAAFRRPDGTVGAVARDLSGNLAAGTSTGGTLFKPVGRVGDSPLPGCGYYADNQSGAVSCTGHGESIIRIQLARSAADLAQHLARSGPAAGIFNVAAQAAIDTLTNRVDGRGGLIMIDNQGRVGYANNTPHMAYAFLVRDMTEPAVGI